MVLANLKKKIVNIINDFGKEPRIFKSEAQFQFDLAWELKASFNEEEQKEYTVYLEYLGEIERDEGGEDIKRFFTDIMIVGNNGDYFPIELKYKTAKLDVDDDFIHLADHGACDLGRFDFLYDVERIQKLKRRDNGYVFDPRLKIFGGGIAIMLTNDKHYWDYSRRFLADRNGDNNKHPLYEEFCIGEGDIIDAGAELHWKNNGIGTCVQDTWRNDAHLFFDKQHTCHWNTYLTGKYGYTDFNYLLFDVNK